MRILITENKLTKIIHNFLETYISKDSILYMDSFIMVYNENLESDEIEGDPSILFEYDYYDGRLYVNGHWFSGFLSMFNLDKKEGYKLIDSWFENKFDVEVNPEVR